MSYSVQIDLEEAMDVASIIHLTDDEKSSTSTTDLAQAISDNAKIKTRIDRAIADGDATIDGYLRGRYSVPLSPVPPFVRHLSVALAIYALFERRAHVFGAPPDWTEARRKNARDALQAIRKGDLDLGVEPPPAASAAIIADTDGPERDFTTETMKDF